MDQTQVNLTYEVFYIESITYDNLDKHALYNINSQESKLTENIYKIQTNERKLSGFTYTYINMVLKLSMHSDTYETINFMFPVNPFIREINRKK